MLLPQSSQHNSTQKNNMQAAQCFGTLALPLVRVPSKTLAVAPWKKTTKSMLQPPIKATPPMSSDTSTTVDYNSQTSVFPAEACETIGGEACEVEMYPEVKLEPEEAKSSNPKSASEPVDREYLDYNTPKTVFPGEACDDLGGEFCEPEYQKDVY